MKNNHEILFILSLASHRCPDAGRASWPASSTSWFVLVVPTILSVHGGRNVLCYDRNNHVSIFCQSVARLFKAITAELLWVVEISSDKTCSVFVERIGILRIAIGDARPAIGGRRPARAHGPHSRRGVRAAWPRSAVWRRRRGGRRGSACAT